MTKQEHIIRKINDTVDTMVGKAVMEQATKVVRSAIRNGLKTGNEYFWVLYAASYQTPITHPDVQDLVSEAYTAIWDELMYLHSGAGWQRKPLHDSWCKLVFWWFAYADNESDYVRSIEGLVGDYDYDNAVKTGEVKFNPYKLKATTIHDIECYLNDRIRDPEIAWMTMAEAFKAVNHAIYEHRRPQDGQILYLYEQDENGEYKWHNVAAEMKKMLNDQLEPIHDTLKAVIAELTPRERDILLMTAKGLSSKQIARKLRLKSATGISNHRAKIRVKASKYFELHGTCEELDRVCCTPYLRNEIHPTDQNAEEALQMVERVINHMN